MNLAGENRLLIHKAEVVVVPVDAEHVSEARDAYRRFGKGRHAAGLNFGDLFAYALARASGEPLLFKGDDFTKTDIRRVIDGGTMAGASVGPRVVH